MKGVSRQGEPIKRNCSRCFSLFYLNIFFSPKSFDQHKTENIFKYFWQCLLLSPVPFRGHHSKTSSSISLGHLCILCPHMNYIYLLFFSLPFYHFPGSCISKFLPIYPLSLWTYPNPLAFPMSDDLLLLLLTHSHFAEASGLTLTRIHNPSHDLNYPFLSLPSSAQSLPVLPASKIQLVSPFYNK